MTLPIVPIALFPNGIAHYLLGGVLIGVAVAVVYGFTGIIAGASTFLDSTLSYVSTLSRFQDPKYAGTRRWRLVFTLGIVLGAASWALVTQDGIWVTAVQPWRLALGGVLIGVGTRLGKGCTSGHGVCGVASASRSSFVNVALFLGVAIVVANLVELAGVTP